MGPVTGGGIDSPVWPGGQWVATLLTFGLAVVVLAWAASVCRRERIVWPVFVLVSGTLTCLMEPLFDHLYGLWFREKGQWHLYTTFGSHQPIWVPAAYLTFYGGATVFIARTIARRPALRTVWAMYAFIVAMAIAAELTYISALGVYQYQGSQPFVVLGYPIFLGFTNAMSALVSGIVVYRLEPLLGGPGYLYLIPIVPMAFAAGLFGSGILYLSVRHSGPNPPMIWMHVAALTVVGAIAGTVGLLGRLLVVPAAAAESDGIAARNAQRANLRRRDQRPV